MQHFITLFDILATEARKLTVTPDKCESDIISIYMYALALFQSGASELRVLCETHDAFANLCGTARSKSVSHNDVVVGQSLTAQGGLLRGLRPPA
jgi:hypothetical protein